MSLHGLYTGCGLLPGCHPQPVPSVQLPRSFAVRALLTLGGYYSKESRLMRSAQRLYTAVTEQAACPQFLSGGTGSWVGMGGEQLGCWAGVKWQRCAAVRAARPVLAVAAQPSVCKAVAVLPCKYTGPSVLSCHSRASAACSHGHPRRLPADPLLALPPHLAAAGAAAGGGQGRQAAGAGERCRKQQHGAAAASGVGDGSRL